MNKTTKAILYGVGTFALSLLVLVGARALIKGTPFVDGFKDWYNWAIAVLSGVSTAYSTAMKDKQDKE